jgi:hypothetical protein
VAPPAALPAPGPAGAEPAGVVGVPASGSLIERLRAGVRGLASDPDASLAGVDAAVAGFLDAWTTMDGASVEAFAAEVAGFYFIAERELDASASLGRATRLVEAAGPTDDAAALPGAVAAAGLVARLNRDDHPSSVEGLLRRRLAGLTDDGRGAQATSFVEGAVVALERAAGVRPADPGAYAEAWGRAADALARVDPAAEQRLVRRLLDTALRSGRDPASDLGLHETIERLADRMSFASPGGDASPPAAARQTLSWLDDPGVSTASVSVLLSRLALAGRIPGTPGDVALSPGAPASERRAVRDVVASRFGLGSLVRDAPELDALRAAASSLLADPVGSPASAPGDLAAASMLNLAAARRWGGADREGVEQALAWAGEAATQAAPPIDVLGANRGRLEDLTAPARSPDGEWAIRYLNQRSDNASRRELLNTLGNRGGPAGPADADVLAQAALVGPRSVREAAQEVVVLHADDLNVLHGLREHVVRVSERSDVSETIERVTGRALPPPSEPGWAELAKRAIVERILERLAEADASLARLQSITHDAYELRRELLDPLGALARGAAVGGGVSPDRDAAELARARLAEAARYVEGDWAFASLSEIERRSEARRRIASGSVQRFVAEQLALAEASAYLLAAEQPRRAAEVGEIMASLNAGLRDMRDALQQARAAEVALLRVWLLRLGLEVDG